MQQQALSPPLSPNQELINKTQNRRSDFNRVPGFPFLFPLVDEKSLKNERSARFGGTRGGGVVGLRGEEWPATLHRVDSAIALYGVAQRDTLCGCAQHAA